MHIFRHIFLSNYWWHKSDISSQASYRYAILWEAFLDSSDSYFLFAGLVGFYTHLSYMHIFRRIFLSNFWWQKSDMWSQASYRYPISWETFLGPSDSYFLFSDLVGFYTHWTYMRGYHKWALAHCSSCWISVGQAEGNHFSNKGGGSNYLCLPNDPDNGKPYSYANDVLYGAEYSLGSAKPTGFGNLHHKDVPCAVCRRRGKSSVLMIPGKRLFNAYCIAKYNPGFTLHYV